MLLVMALTAALKQPFSTKKFTQKPDADVASCQVPFVLVISSNQSVGLQRRIRSIGLSYWADAQAPSRLQSARAPSFHIPTRLVQ